MSLALAEDRFLGHDDIRVPPLHIWTPPRVSSAAAEVVDFMAMIGRPPDGEQRLALDCLHSEGPGGRWAHFTAAMVEARQQGKTGAVMLPSAMADLFVFGRQLVLWTAHLQSTADKTFADLQELIDGCESLSRRVREITSGNGNHTVTLNTGAMMQFIARSTKAGRGFAKVDSLTLDEAQEVQAGHLGALLPTMAAADDPIVRMAGSAGHAKSKAWRDVRDRGRAGSLDPENGDPTLAYVEWGAKKVKCSAKDCQHQRGTKGCQLDNRERWQEACHTMRSALVPDGRNSPNTIDAFRQQMDPAEFAREILSWWEEAEAAAPVDTEAWKQLTDALSKLGPGQRPVFALDASPKLRTASIGLAGRRADGKIHVELVKYDDGVDWIVADAKALKRKHNARIVMARASPIAAKLGDLQAAGVDPYLMSELEMASAYGLFESDVEAGNIVHLGDQILQKALEGAVLKATGDALAKLSRKLSTDICPVYSVIEAAWALVTLPPPVRVFAAKA